MIQQFDFSIYPRNIEIGAYVCQKKCVSMFIAALFIITPNIITPALFIIIPIWEVCGTFGKCQSAKK